MTLLVVFFCWTPRITLQTLYQRSVIVPVSGLPYPCPRPLFTCFGAPEMACVCLPTLSFFRQKGNVDTTGVRHDLRTGQTPDPKNNVRFGDHLVLELWPLEQKIYIVFGDTGRAPGKADRSGARVVLLSSFGNDRGNTSGHGQQSLLFGPSSIRAFCHSPAEGTGYDDKKKMGRGGRENVDKRPPEGRAARTVERSGACVVLLSTFGNDRGNTSGHGQQTVVRPFFHSGFLSLRC